MTLEDDNMREKKGFTMVELLGVLVVLALITAIAMPVITSTLNSSRKSSYQRQLDMIVAGAKSYGAKNIGNLPVSGSSKTITLRDLKDEGFVEEDIANPETKKKFADTMQIRITNNNGDIEYTIVESTIKDQN